MIGYPDQAVVPYKNPNSLFEQAGISVTKNRNMILMNSISTIRQAIRSGAGTGVLPHFMADSLPDIVTILPDVKIPAIDMYFVYPEDRRHSKRIAIFRDFLVDLVEKTKF